MAEPEVTQVVPDEVAEAHARILSAAEKTFNEADAKHRKRMLNHLGVARANSMSSVGGLRNLFPNLGRLRVKE